MDNTPLSHKEDTGTDTGTATNQETGEEFEVPSCLTLFSEARQCLCK